MTPLSIRVNLAERSYDIVVTSNDPGGFGPFARQHVRATLAVVITDEHVALHARAAEAALSAAGFRSATVILPSGESQKSLGVAASLYDRLVDLRADRRSVIVAVGGGVIGDLAGFVAS